MENTNDMQMQQAVPAEAMPSQPIVNNSPVDETKYASFFQRFAALLVDALLVGMVLGFAGSILKLPETLGQTTYSGLTSLIGMIYYVVMIKTRGVTVGKMALRIRVQKVDTGENLDWLSAILREVVGKTLSAIPLFLGFFWMLWDDKKQTWHDKLASSIVVRE